MKYKPKVRHALNVPHDNAELSANETVQFNTRGGKLDLGVGRVLREQWVGTNPCCSEPFYLVRFKTETLWVQGRDLLFGVVKEINNASAL